MWNWSGNDVDKALTDEERTRLKAAALRGLHSLKQQVEQSREGLAWGEEVLVTPEDSDRYNAYLNELGHAGVDIPHGCYSRPPIIAPNNAQTRHDERMSGSHLLAKLTEVLALVDPEENG
jgi:hypothetical protein